MVEQCKEIVHKFNSVYGETLTDPQIVLPDNQACLRLPGIDGKAKMSKSLGNCIYLSDEPQDIKKKVMSMFTDPNHLRVEDPGPVSYTHLDVYKRQMQSVTIPCRRSVFLNFDKNSSVEAKFLSFLFLATISLYSF